MPGGSPKLAAFLDEAETDVLAYMSFPAQHRVKLHSTDEMDKRFLRAGQDSILLFVRAASISVPTAHLAAVARRGRSRLAAFCGHRKAWP